LFGRLFFQTWTRDFGLNRKPQREVPEGAGVYPIPGLTAHIGVQVLVIPANTYYVARNVPILGKMVKILKNSSKFGARHLFWSENPS